MVNHSEVGFDRPIQCADAKHVWVEAGTKRSSGMGTHVRRVASPSLPDWISPCKKHDCPSHSGKPPAPTSVQILDNRDQHNEYLALQPQHSQLYPAFSPLEISRL